MNNNAWNKYFSVSISSMMCAASFSKHKLINNYVTFQTNCTTMLTTTTTTTTCTILYMHCQSLVIVFVSKLSKQNSYLTRERDGDNIIPTMYIQIHSLYIIKIPISKTSFPFVSNLISHIQLL